MPCDWCSFYHPHPIEKLVIRTLMLLPSYYNCSPLFVLAVSLLALLALLCLASSPIEEATLLVPRYGMKGLEDGLHEGRVG